MSEFPVVVQKYHGALHEGMTVKNYKELCSLLGEDIQYGNSKKAQHKEWQRYFDYEKVGHKYIITELYSKPLPKEDGRINNGQSIYSEHIELLLLHYLSKQEDKTIKLTNKNIFLLLGMANRSYMKKNSIIKNELKDDMITDFQINHFYQRSYKKLNRILYDALRSLKNRRLINYSEEKMIKITEFDDYDGWVDNIRVATQDEKNIIMKTEREVLLEMGYESIVQIHLKFKNDEFYSKVKQKLFESYGIHYYYNQISLWFFHEHIIQAKEKAEIDMKKKLLNTEVINFMNNQAEKNLEKNKKQYEEMSEQLINECIGKPNPFKIKKIFKLDEEVYRYAQYQLAEYLLRIN